MRRLTGRRRSTPWRCAYGGGVGGVGLTPVAAMQRSGLRTGAWYTHAGAHVAGNPGGTNARRRRGTPELLGRHQPVRPCAVLREPMADCLPGRLLHGATSVAGGLKYTHVDRSEVRRDSESRHAVVPVRGPRLHGWYNHAVAGTPSAPPRSRASPPARLRRTPSCTTNASVAGTCVDNAGKSVRPPARRSPTTHAAHADRLANPGDQSAHSSGRRAAMSPRLPP